MEKADQLDVLVHLAIRNVRAETEAIRRRIDHWAPRPAPQRVCVPSQSGRMGGRAGGRHAPK